MQTPVLLLLLCAAGVFATEYNCDAESKVCQNGGICHDNIQMENAGNLVNPGTAGNGWATPQCVCAAPFAGGACEHTVRECKDSPCQNGGTCVAADCLAVNGVPYDCFTCQCAKGWTGSYHYQGTGGLCDTPANDCSVNSCGNGTCSNVVYNSFQCACHSTWQHGTAVNGAVFTNCTYNCLPNTGPAGGAATPCQNGGTCNGGSCSCLPGFYGVACEYTAATITCQNGGTSVWNPSLSTNVGGYQCSCLPSWTGTTCTVPTSYGFCASNPCQNGAQCHDASTDGPLSPPYCACADEHSGFLCNGPSFCESNPSICQHSTGPSSGCVNQVPTPAFNNNPGNGLILDTSNVAQGACTNCTAGWAGQYCQLQIIGCGVPGVGCAVNGHSIDQTGSGGFCPCLDQASCANWDPVAWNIGTCACSSGYYDCRCNSTYVSRCPGLSSGTPGANVDAVCQNGGSCMEWAEGWGCSCRPGFWGSSCQNYDNPCLNNPCQNGGACEILQNGMNTSPQPAYEAPLLTGSYYSNDRPLLIGNDPAAMLVGVSPQLDDRYWPYVCNCKPPFYGRNCELVLPSTNFCTNNACQNGATCTGYNPGVGIAFQATDSNIPSVPLPYTCQCTGNWTGSLCTIPIQTCSNTPGLCLNGGVCNTVIYGNLVQSRPLCACPCGYAGDRCEIAATNVGASAVAQFSAVSGGVGYRLEFCSQVNCQNGGTCVHTLDGQSFMCQCTSGWADRYCQTRTYSGASSLMPSLAAASMAVFAALALRV